MMSMNVLCVDILGMFCDIEYLMRCKVWVLILCLLNFLLEKWFFSGYGVNFYGNVEVLGFLLVLFGMFNKRIYVYIYLRVC